MLGFANRRSVLGMELFPPRDMRRSGPLYPGDGGRGTLVPTMPAAADRPSRDLRRELTAVPESPLVQIATLAESMPASIKLCYGESDLPTPAFIVDAAHQAALEGRTFYTHTAGYPELRRTIAAKIAELHGVEYDESEVMVTVGASMAIYTAIRACIGPGDNAVIVSPAYAIYANAVTMCGGEPRFAPLAHSGVGYALDVDRVRRAIDRNTRLLIVNSPSNPTGMMLTVDEQRMLASIAEEHNLRLLADEVYDRITYEVPIAPSFARVVDDKSRLIVVNSFSKTYCMTGWRLGWAQSSADVIRAMTTGVEFMTSNATAPVQRAGIAALRDGEQCVAELRSHFAARRAQVVDGLSVIEGVRATVPAGSFFAFFTVDGVSDSAPYALELVRETGVALAPGSAFGAGGESALRMCFASTREIIDASLDRLARSLSGRTSKR
jgi:aspartate/methionine/tyrosine aminotransferase